MDRDFNQLERIAVIGIAGRFPDAPGLPQFFRNLSAGVESVTTFTDEQLLSAGVEPNLVHAPNYVKAGVLLHGVDLFDAEFFGFTPREAELTDPQHRMFLECAWEALEDAGYDPGGTRLRIGVFAGAGNSGYAHSNLASRPDLIASLNFLQKLIASDNDYLSTRVAYKLNLKGPSLTIQTACSTSLVATHVACQSLLNGECDIALAGGVSIRVPQIAGYLHNEGSPLSGDGHCRAFDASAQGMMAGSGAGIVVLKRLADALEDGDQIRAVILGSAINNDGTRKVGYTAPSVDGQADVIAEAQALAGVSADDVSYIEAHGTGTSLGDPIEIAGLTAAFRRTTDNRGFCAIGSVKTNIGHLAAAAGAAGLIKVVLSLQNRVLFPSLNFKKANPAIDFGSSPFYVQQTASDWEGRNGRRVAGVSSFGIGGTNAHAVLDEAPSADASGPSRPWQLLLLSARTKSALENMTGNLGGHLRNNPQVHLADVAYTLQKGRKKFAFRRMLVCQNTEDAVSILDSRDPKRSTSRHQEAAKTSVVFMFPGQGSQYVNMGLELYRTEPEFRTQIDRCSELLRPHLSGDLRDLLYPETYEFESASQKLKQTLIAQPALFAVEYALARLMMSWGVKPAAMVGHSIGEYVAACLAGVFTLETALALVATRGRLMQSLPGGSMLAVSAPAQQIAPLLNGKLSLAAINSPSQCVISGEAWAVKDLEKVLSQSEAVVHHLHTSHAFHSHMVDPILTEFVQAIEQVDLRSPNIPILSTVSGAWIRPEEMATPAYWARNLRDTVRFSECVGHLTQDAELILLEIGPGNTLATCVKQHQNRKGHIRAILSTIRHPQDIAPDSAFLLTTLGRLWLADVEVDWTAFYRHERRHRISLPTYPFEKQRYWIEPSPKIRPADSLPAPAEKNSNIDEWFYAHSWKRAQLPETRDNGKNEYSLVFLDESGFGAKLIAALQSRRRRVVVATRGTTFQRVGENTFIINPGVQGDYNKLLRELSESGRNLDTVLHLWSVTPSDDELPLADSCNIFRELAFNSLLFLARALADQFSGQAIEIKVVSNHLHEVTGEEALSPAKALLLGPCVVIPREYANLHCANIDLDGDQFLEQYAQMLANELNARSTDPVVAYRGAYRWVRTFEPVALRKASPPNDQQREKGTYLITGGTGGIGLSLAEYLAKNVRANLVLVSRTGLPPREEWTNWLETHSESDDVSRKIRRLQVIEQQGSEVLVLKADVTNLTQLQTAITNSRDRFGEIHGVIHAAGVPGGGLMALKTPDAAASVMAPKVDGTVLLGEMFSRSQLDFFILCSSYTALLGAVGQADYCAANAFLDAYAAKYHARNVVSANWSAWQEVGMAASAVVPLALRDEREKSLRAGISPEEGKEAFARILGASFAQLVICPQPFEALVQARTRSNAPTEPKEEPLSNRGSHQRPILSSDYVAPGNSTEQTVAEIWQDILGISNIGIHDNFFDLGGSSLLVTNLVARLKAAFSVKLSLAGVFENPTVHLLSEIIRNGNGERPSFAESKSRGQRRREIRSQA